MADVFISYSRVDHERVQPIADRLTSLGYSVWWEKPLRTGRAALNEVERELDEARAVLTVWSGAARNSTLVQAQASRALDAKKLVQLKIDHVQLPAPFEQLALADMTNERNAAWGPLEDLLTQIARNSKPIEPEGPGSVGMIATAAASGSPKLLTIATGATLAAYAGALSATQNGVMTSEQLQVALVGMIGVGGACAALCAYRLYAIARSGG